MSNRVTLQTTVFQNYKEDTKSFGYRMYDDYGQTYCNTLEEKDLNKTPLKFLAFIKDKLDEAGDAMMEHALEHGMYINGSWYENEEIVEKFNGG